jgi:IDEAL domain
LLYEGQAIQMTEHPDLRDGDPAVHDLIAEIDEAIDRGDEPLVEKLSEELHRKDPSMGAGSDT